MEIIDSIKAKDFFGDCAEITLFLENEGKFAEQFVVRRQTWTEDENGDTVKAGSDSAKEFSVAEFGYTEALEKARETFRNYKSRL